MAAKVRPVLIVSVECGESDRALATVLPHTTILRGSPYEIAVSAAFLRPGAFVVQGVATYPTARGIRRIGTLPADQFDSVFSGLLRWLGYTE